MDLVDKDDQFTGPPGVLVEHVRQTLEVTAVAGSTPTPPELPASAPNCAFLKTGHAEIGDVAGELFERDVRFKASQMGTEAEVYSSTKLAILLVLACPIR